MEVGIIGEPFLVDGSREGRTRSVDQRLRRRRRCIPGQGRGGQASQNQVLSRSGFHVLISFSELLSLLCHAFVTAPLQVLTFQPTRWEHGDQRPSASNPGG